MIDPDDDGELDDEEVERPRYQETEDGDLEVIDYGDDEDEEDEEEGE